MSWGNVYRSTHFGNTDESNGWGSIYVLLNLSVALLTSATNFLTSAINYFTDQTKT